MQNFRCCRIIFHRPKRYCSCAEQQPMSCKQHCPGVSASCLEFTFLPHQKNPKDQKVQLDLNYFEIKVSKSCFVRDWKSLFWPTRRCQTEADLDRLQAAVEECKRSELQNSQDLTTGVDLRRFEDWTLEDLGRLWNAVNYVCSLLCSVAYHPSARFTGLVWTFTLRSVKFCGWRNCRRDEHRAEIWHEKNM